MPWGRREDTDLEVISIEVAAREEASPRRSGRDPNRVAVLMAVVMVVVVALATAVALHRQRKGSASSAAPTADEINRRASVRLSRFVTVVGDKMLSRAITDTNADGPLGLIRLAPAGPGAAATLAANATSIVAEGTDFSGVERTGTWAYPAIGGRPPAFLGPSTGFVPSVDSRAVWLTAGSNVREVNVSDGSTIGRPYSIEGRLVAAAGAGLVIQRGEQVIWWLPGTPRQSELIGTGQAFGALGDYILWQTARGLLTITDPNTGRTVGVAFSLPPSQQVRAATMTSDLFRVAVATRATVVISDTFKHHLVDVHLGPVNGLAWLDDYTLLARVGPRAVMVVDATTGAVAREPDLAFDAQGLGIIEAPAPRPTPQTG